MFSRCTSQFIIIYFVADVCLQESYQELVSCIQVLMIAAVFSENSTTTIYHQYFICGFVCTSDEFRCLPGTILYHPIKNV